MWRATGRSDLALGARVDAELPRELDDLLGICGRLRRRAVRDRGDHLLGLAADAARSKLTREHLRARQRRSDELHLLAPLQSEPLLNADVAVSAALPLREKFADLARDCSLHRYASTAARKPSLAPRPLPEPNHANAM